MTSPCQMLTSPATRKVCTKQEPSVATGGRRRRRRRKKMYLGGNYQRNLTHVTLPVDTGSPYFRT